jgi:hypothetical protein
MSLSGIRRQGEEDSNGFRRHRSQIAEAGYNGPKAGLFEGDPISAEVNALDGEVAADQNPTLQHRAIVAGAGQDPGRERRVRTQELPNEVEFRAGSEANAGPGHHRAGS